MFDPFWSTVADAGVGVVFHVSNSGYNRMFGTYWSEDPANPSHRQSPLQWALCNTERPIVVKDGRFGPYVTDGETNASLRKGDSVEELTMERALELLADRRARGPAKKKSAAKKKAPAKKKATAKKAGTKKAGTKKAATKKASTKKASAKRPTTKKPTTKKLGARSVPRDVV